MSDERKPGEIAASVTSAKVNVFSESAVFKRELESYVPSRFAISSDKNERRQAVTLQTVAPALRSGRGLKPVVIQARVFR